MNRLRLSGVYVLIMLTGLLLFAAAAVFAIDRAQRSALDERLKTAARAAMQFIDMRHGRIALDRSDREQINEVVGPNAAVAVVDSTGAVVYSSAVRIPPEVRRLPGGQPNFAGSRQNDTDLRIFAFPIVTRWATGGAIVVWTASDWIDQTDRNVAIALAAGAFLIAALALIAGSVVTRRALEEAFARQRRFTADASHELRAPLAVIRAEADLALRKDREAPEYRSAMEVIASEADHMETLIGDLLSAARAESGALNRERVDVRAVLARVAERLASAAAAKDASVSVQAQGELGILADSQALERALLAIGHNAVRYAPDGSIVALSARRIDDAVEIAIQDRGTGFSQAALEHALERFWREPGSPVGTGSGLGLAIARSIVEANRGVISLANAPNGGATVRLRFSAI